MVPDTQCSFVDGLIISSPDQNFWLRIAYPSVAGRGEVFMPLGGGCHALVVGNRIHKNETDVEYCRGPRALFSFLL